MARYPVITIDGPSGAGKGTVCSSLAKSLGYAILDSGALYRIVGLKAHEANLILATTSSNNNLDEAAIASLTAKLDICFLPASDGGYVRVIVDGVDVSESIRDETVGHYASVIAPLPQVRAALLNLQQDMAKHKGLVADGRDMGTVVFPDADVKVFLTATSQARAHRRVAQLTEAGKSADFDNILKQIQARDIRDESRTVSPSKPASDALIIDSSNMSEPQVFAMVKQHCQSQGICFI